MDTIKEPVNDIECREPLEVQPQHINRSVSMFSITNEEEKRWRTILLSIGVGGVLLLTGFVIYEIVNWMAAYSSSNSILKNGYGGFGLH